jgi:hypothetical protein
LIASIPRINKFCSIEARGGVVDAEDRGWGICYLKASPLGRIAIISMISFSLIGR